jgi:hypothetical protein
MEDRLNSLLNQSFHGIKARTANFKSRRAFDQKAAGFSGKAGGSLGGRFQLFFLSGRKRSAGLIVGGQALRICLRLSLQFEID